MTQERLNHLLLLNVHKQLTDELDLVQVANHFVQENEHRFALFGTFKNSDFLIIFSLLLTLVKVAVNPSK